MKPPQVGDPLPAAALEADAERSGVASDQATARDVDTHLPASDAELVGEPAKTERLIERDLANLPPG